MKLPILPVIAGAVALGIGSPALADSPGPANPAPEKSGEQVREPAPGPDAPAAEPDVSPSPEDDEQPAWVAVVNAKILPLLDENRFEEAKVAAEALVKEHPDMPAKDKAQLLLYVTLEVHIAKQDAAAALQAVDEISAAYPDAGLRDDAAEIKRTIRTRIDSEQADEVRAKLAPLTGDKADPAKLKTAAEALMAERPKMNQNAKAIVMFRIVVEPLVEAGDETAALRELAALAAAYPESDFTKEADSFKADMLERIAERKVAAIMQPLEPLIEAGKLDKARAEAEKHFAAHPELGQNTRATVLFQVVVLPRVMAGDANGAAKELEALVKAYPDSDLAKEAGDIRASIKDTLEAEAALPATEEQDEKEAIQEKEAGSDKAAAPVETLK